MGDDMKEAVIKILEILSTVAPMECAVNQEGYSIPSQYVIDELEVKSCKELLKRIDPDNQQLRVKL